VLRFAPSPTGDMHIGNLRVALFNYILKIQKNEKLLIRIEDTDKARNIKGKDDEIFKLLEIFGIEYDQVAYQSDNLAIHQKLAMKLLVEKKAFSCFCSDETLDRKRQEAKEKKIPYRYDGTCQNLSDNDVIDNQKPFVLRIKQPKTAIKFKDTIKGEFEYQPKDIDSFIILRHDKSPTYNFAASVDDMIFDIGPNSASEIAEIMHNAGTIVWNGPVGVFELDQLAGGTQSLANAIAESKAFSIVGGGDTLAALDKFNIEDKVSYISTGGGSFLEFLEGKKLPVVEVLESRTEE